MNLLILDIDGTMTQSESHHLGAFEDAMRSVGIQEINTNWEKYTHITDTHVFKENYIAQFGVEPDEMTFELLEEIMTSNIQEFVAPVELPGARQVVEMLKAHPNFHFAYATGSLYTPAKYKLEETNIYFKEELLMGCNGYESREEIVTAAIDAAKAKYGVSEFDNILSVGDGVWDLKTARNLGLAFLGMGEKNQEVFAKEGVKYAVKNWEEVDVAYLQRIL